MDSAIADILAGKKAADDEQRSRQQGSRLEPAPIERGALGLKRARKRDHDRRAGHRQDGHDRESQRVSVSAEPIAEELGESERKVLRAEAIIEIDAGRNSLQRIQNPLVIISGEREQAEAGRYGNEQEPLGCLSQREYQQNEGIE